MPINVKDANEVVFNLFDQADSPIGQSTVTFGETSGLPAMYTPRAVVTTTKTSKGANINYKVNISAPVARKVDGVWKAENTFRCTFSFSALQNEAEDELRARVVDAMITLLAKNRANIMKGNATFLGLDRL